MQCNENADKENENVDNDNGNSDNDNDNADNGNDNALRHLDPLHSMLLEEHVQPHLGGRRSGMDGEDIFFTERGREGQGEKSMRWSRAGNPSPPSPQCGAGQGRGQNLRGGEHTVCIS